jgi:3'-phosphoadenosine 5'-phosphosulfate sulfotransferase (PAPS reductase)/FAD synthetase
MQEKVDEALIRIVEQYANSLTGLFVGHSGGKDSQVVAHLTQQVYPEVIMVHNPKLNTHEDTKIHIYDISSTNNVYFVPFEHMKFFIHRYDLTCQVDGTRIAEHTRIDKSSDLIVDGENVSRENMGHHTKNGIHGLEILYPIYDWTDEEVFQYLRDNNIQLSKEYVYV